MQNRNLNKFVYSYILSTVLALLLFGHAMAGGGMVLKDDVCIIEIDFYSAHFTAYQPESRGNQQFCQELPDTGATIFVLDYLHPNLKDVPVSMRIIHDVTGQGSYVKLKHIVEIEDIDSHTVFFQSPLIRPNASFQVEFEIVREGSYIGIVTAGHPSQPTIYTAVFPFEVGGTDINYSFLFILLLVAAAIVLFYRSILARKAVGQVEASS